MTGWELRIWRKSMLWSREKAAREFGVTQRTWHAWENAEQVDVTVWRTTQALSVRDLLPHMQGMRKADIIRRLENDTYPLLLTAASGDMTAHRQDVRVNLILCQLLTSEAGMAVQGFILPQALFTQTLYILGGCEDN